jgi:hypothetical protein
MERENKKVGRVSGVNEVNGETRQNKKQKDDKTPRLIKK